MKLWHVHEDTFDPARLHAQETVYTIGNGYFGTRGTFEEGYPGAEPATLLYGVFDKIEIGKEELANAPDWLPIRLFVNGERFRLDRGKILSYQRTLDMHNAVLSRSVSWESPGGIRLTMKSERFASLAAEHVGAIRYSVTIDDMPHAEERHGNNQEVNVTLRAAFNLAVGNYDLMHWESIDQGHQDEELIWFQTQTRHSGVQLVQTMSLTTQAQDFDKALFGSDTAPGITLRGKLASGETLTAEKIVVMFTSRDGVDPLHAALEHHQRLMSGEAFPYVKGEHDDASPYTTLLTQHEGAWHDFWQDADVIIEGDDEAQMGIRYNIYQLRISASSHDSCYSIAAKGLTGFGYRGHVFHDTEIFMLPFFAYVQPSIARNLLLYRYRTLPAARQKAANNDYHGAQYSWESTLSGQETTPPAIIHPENGEIIPVLNGHLELHITASVAHATWQYWQISGDDEFMHDFGAEILLSTAAFWASRAEFNTERNDYEINDVIGPDEWHEHVNNNIYTNYMAKWNIQAAIDILYWLRSNNPSKVHELEEQLHLNDEQLDHWHDVSSRMRILQGQRTGLFEQFDGFFQLESFDQEKYKGRKTSYQGLLGVQPIQKYQIIKQADVLMLLTVLDSQFDLQTKRVNWDYYFPITDHDYGSSLTPALHVILACELGLTETAYEMFMKGALTDLEDLRGNTSEGIHDACAGAVWQATVLGFAGLRLAEDGYTTSPTWPDGWTRLAFMFCHKGNPIKIDLRRP